MSASYTSCVVVMLLHWLVRRLNRLPGQETGLRLALTMHLRIEEASEEDPPFNLAYVSYARHDQRRAQIKRSIGLGHDMMFILGRLLYSIWRRSKNIKKVQCGH